MAHGQGGVTVGTHGQAQMAGQVLAGVDGHDRIAPRADAGADRHHLAHGRHAPLLEAQGQGQRSHRAPRGAIEARLAPSRRLASHIDDAAVVDIGPQQRPGRAAPRVVGRDRLARTIDQRQLELGEQRGGVAINRAPCLPCQFAAPPAIGELGRDHVLAGAQKFDDVVARVEEPLFVRRPARLELIRGDFASVDPQPAQTQRGGIEPGLLDRRSQRKRAAQQWQRAGLDAADVEIG